MKRIILIIGALLIGLVIRAQSVTYTCRYWFDQNFAQAAMATFSNSTWQAELDVGSLADGLHTLHLHVMDTSLKWSAPQNYLFLKTTVTQPENYVFHHWIDQRQIQSSAIGNGQFLLDVATLDAGLHTLHVMLKGSEYSASQSYIFLKPELTGFDAEKWVYHCWFDEDYAHRETDSLGNGNFLLDVSDLEEGLHTLNVILQGNSLTATQSYMFMRVEMIETNSIDMSNLTYSCWFDQDYDQRVTDSLRDGNILLDVADLTDGLHTVNVMLQGGTGTLTSTRTYMFLKVAVEDPSIEQQYCCWFDQDYSTMQTGMLGGGIFQLEVSDLTNGLHIVNVQIEKETRTAPQSYFFYKIPFGGNGLNKWEYCINGDWANKITTNVVPSVDMLSIVSLLPVPTQPIRSTCFHFHPNGDEPYLNAKNEITLRFWTADEHFVDRSAFYVDEYVSEPIQADDLERNTTVCIPAPRDNQMQWYKVPLVVGDSIAFRTDKACTVQLFAPSGEEVYTATASEALVLGGIHAWEDGDYYLVVHDVTGSGDEICLTNVYVHKYAILAYDVHLVGNGGCSTITFQGNGFNSLLDAYLVNYQNDTIHRLDIGHESNTITTVTFNFYEVNLGVYDAVFQFYDETVRINGALEVQEPVDILLTSSVSYPSQFLRNTPCTYTYTITNNGNMSAYGVPIFVYISSATFEGISHIKIEGLGLKSLAEYIDIDSLSQSEKEEIRIWAEEMGDAFSFFEFSIVDEEIGDSIVVRSNYFFMNFAPFETKTLSFQITADEILDVWITIPDGVIQPLVFIPNRGFVDSFCCVQDKVSCILDLFCNVLDLADRVTNLVPGTTAAMALKAANCICGFVSSLNTSLSKILCEEEVPENLFEAFKNNLSSALDLNGLVGSVTNCLADLIPVNAIGRAKKIKDMADVARKIANQIADSFLGFTGYNSASNCYKAFYTKKPGCPRGDSDGGPSEPVNSLDPNDIHGYLSESGSHYMRQEIQNVQYEIEFENDTTLATAAAHTIIVRDTLNRSRFDLNSLAARSVTIGDKRLDLNGEQTFARTLDLRPELYVIAQINQDYDPTTGIIQWTIQSLDPMTMEPTNDPNQGVLPVNCYGNGVGFIDYSINLKQAFPDGTKIRNRAGIIFDQNEVIMTPTWTNIIDAVKPTSYIENVTFEADTLNFSFVSSDNRSGVWYHTLYYRNNSTEMEWRVKVPRIFENSYMLQFDEYQTTEYLVMAVDSAGNHEEKDMMAEYVYFYDGPEPVCQSDMLVQGWNWWSTYLDITLADLKTALVEALPGTTINIKSQTQNVKYQNGRWAGQLTTLDLTRMYMISVENDCEISLVGMPINLSGLTATIISGANWLAFPYSESISVSDFFGSFPMNNDLVKSQSQNAKYQNNRWGGQLNTLVPGKGYIYISNSPGTRTFTFPTSTK